MNAANRFLGVSTETAGAVVQALSASAPHTADELLDLLLESGAQLLFTPPAIGEYWPGQGGVYAGQVREDDGTQYHLILSDLKPAQRLPHAAATKWAKSLSADGHADFELPTRRASSLLYANLSDRFEKAWHWTSTDYSASYAWHCLFSYGDQFNYDKSYAGCARAVRRFIA